MSSPSVVTPADAALSIYGILSRYSTALTPREISNILGTCYSGLGMFNCISAERGVDFHGYNTKYYNSINLLKGQIYCTQCCGTNPTLYDDWDLYCPVTEEWFTKLQSVTYIGAEFRFATKTSKSDTNFITCPLKSNACNYSDTGETLGCDVNYPNLEYIIGYDLTIRVNQYNKNFKYWKGVSSCEAISMTRSTPLQTGEMFRERIHLYYEPQFQGLDTPKSLILLSLLSFLIFIFCYFCRRDTCVVCQEKLILFFNRCFICRLFDANIPDPLLLNALKTKGEYIQNESLRPERFPGARCCLKIIRTLWILLTLQCCKNTKIIPIEKSKEIITIKNEPDIYIDKGCCRGDDPDEQSCFEVCCCCLVSIYKCCCKKKKKKPKKIQVIELPLQPYVIYDSIRHPNPPIEIIESKKKAENDIQYNEDLELYGDLTTLYTEKDILKENHELINAWKRMNIYKQNLIVKQKSSLFNFNNNNNNNNSLIINKKNRISDPSSSDINNNNKSNNKSNSIINNTINNSFLLNNSSPLISVKSPKMSKALSFLLSDKNPNFTPDDTPIIKTHSKSIDINENNKNIYNSLKPNFYKTSSNISEYTETTEV